MLTEKQQNVLIFVKESYEKEGRFPSLRTIAKHFGVAVRAIQQHISALKKKGYLEGKEARTSTYKLADSSEESPLSYGIPLVGTIAAGAPTVAWERTDEYIDFKPSFFGNSKDLFALKVSGESMLGDQICDGDMAVIKKQQDWCAGDIVALRVDGDEFTLKRLKAQGDYIDLVPSNPDYPVVQVQADRLKIIGKYVGLLRVR